MGWKRFKRKKKRRVISRQLPKRPLVWNKTLKTFSILRSIWLQQMVNHFTQGGKKLTATGVVVKTMVRVKQLYGISPLIILFEALEAARFPLRVVRRKRGRRVLIWLEVIQWWKQYSLTLIGFRACFRIPRFKISAEDMLLQELVALRESPHKSRVYRRKLALCQLAMECRLQSHYRWRR